MITLQGELGTAIFSDDMAHRYMLTRGEPETPTIGWSGLNPSTASHDINDNTITKEWTFSTGWGYGQMYMFNASPFRATDPKDMMAFEKNGNGYEQFNINLQVIAEHIEECQIFVCAWGDNAVKPGFNRAHLFKKALIDMGFGDKLYYLHGVNKNGKKLGLTDKGQPRHPLYMPLSSELRKLA